MNIAERTLQLKKDFDEVYKSGQSSMVDESKIIEKTVSGEYISVDDISEIPHDVKVRLTSGNGKNMWKHGDITFTRVSSDIKVDLLAGVTYTFSAVVTSSDTDANICLVYDVTNGKTIVGMGRGIRYSKTFTPTSEIKLLRFYASEGYSNSANDTATFKDIMIEEISGENLFDINDSTIEKKRRLSANAGTSWSNSADGSDNFNVSHYVPVEGGKNYTAYNTYTGSSWYCWYDKDKVYISGGGTTAGKILTAPSNACYIRFDYPATDTNVTFCELFEPSEYEPYKEILTDYSGVSFNTYGKNLFNQAGMKTGTQSGVTLEYLEEEDCFLLNGTSTLNENKFLTYIKVKGQYGEVNTLSMTYISGDITIPSGDAVFYIGRYGYTDSGNGNWSCVNLTTLNTSKTMALTGTMMDRAWIYLTSGISFVNYKFRIQLEHGSQPTLYEKFQGQTLTANSDGTVEGITSQSPYMYMTTDNPNVTINAEYHKSYGMQTEYDRFWDSYQDKGNRRDYHGGFGGKGWNKETFKPKYDVIVDGGDRMFMWFNWNNAIFDLKEHLENLGITLDFSQSVSSCYIPFYRANISRLGTIDISKSSSTSLTTFFYYSPIIEIEKFIVNSTQDMSSAFEGMSALEIISFGGTIGGNTNFKWSTKLNKASILNIFEHLSTAVTGKTLTLSATAVTNAFGSTTATEWTTLVATKTNWTISLV